MKGIVDRIESNFVIVEVDGEYISYDLDLFPSAIKDGDLVEIREDGVEILEEETKTRGKYMENLFEELLNRKPK